jgi:hypothetical protein
MECVKLTNTQSRILVFSSRLTTGHLSEGVLIPAKDERNLKFKVSRFQSRIAFEKTLAQTQ